MKHRYVGITLKICLSILVIETLFLAGMGTYYIKWFWQEIDRSVAEKMVLPSILMTQRALNFDSVADFTVLGELLQEKIEDAFITRKNGTIYYSADPSRIGRNYADFLDQEEPVRISGDLPESFFFSYTTGNGNNYRTVLSPLTVKDQLLGVLYIKIKSDLIKKRKNEVLVLFLAGSLATILMTTLLEAYFVRCIIIPRLKKTSSALQEVEKGNLAVRMPNPGASDEMADLIRQVNSMIATIEKNTKDLQLLNQAGEMLAKAATHEEIVESAIAVFEKYLSSSFSESQRQEVSAIFHRPGSGAVMDDALAAVSGGQDFRKTDANTKEFLSTLRELIVNALRKQEDLVEIKNAEEKYRSLFSQAVEGIFRTTLTGRVLVANPSMAAMAGYGSPEEMIAACHDLAMIHYENPGDRERLMELITRQGRVNDFQFLLKRNTGSTFWASLSAHAVRDSNREIVAIEGMIIDISERKRREQAERDQQAAEAVNQANTVLLATLKKKNDQLTQALSELQATQEQLLQSEKMAGVGLTAAGVAHDLNNILSGIMSYPEMILMDLPEESTLRKPLESIMTSGKRAAAVVEDLLTLSRSAMRTQQLVSLNSLVEEYLQSPEFRKMIADFPGITLVRELGESLPNINCSPVHIQKVIMNLITNAVEATGSSGKVTVITECHVLTDKQAAALGKLEAGKYIVMKIVDDGRGIAKNDLKHIFEPFYTKKVIGRSGTGLGLTIVWNCIEEHGGVVTVHSKRTGTIFTVYLRASDGEIEQQQHGTGVAGASGRGTVLVVDDEPLQREIACKMLSYLGYIADDAASGEEALEYLKERTVDLVILDMIMYPGLNGLETYARIIERYPGQKAIIASGFSENEEARKVLELGAGCFLKKPYTLDELARAVKGELNG